MGKDLIMDLKSYEESLIGGLNDPDEVKAEIEEIRKAKIGTLKPNCWKKISEDEIEVFEM